MFLQPWDLAATLPFSMGSLMVLMLLLPGGADDVDYLRDLLDSLLPSLPYSPLGVLCTCTFCFLALLPSARLAHSNPTPHPGGATKTSFAAEL